MANNNDEQRGASMATIEERLSALEEQAELNRQAVNDLIERDKEYVQQLLSAIGQIKVREIPKVEPVKRVINGGKK